MCRAKWEVPEPTTVKINIFQYKSILKVSSQQLSQTHARPLSGKDKKENLKAGKIPDPKEGEEILRADP